MDSKDLPATAAVFLCTIFIVFCRLAKVQEIRLVDHKIIVISPGL